MINLLPPKQKQKFTILYYVRVVSTFFVLSAIVFGLGALLLIPSFIFSKNEIASSAQYLTALKESVELKERSAQGKEIASLVEKQVILVDYGTLSVAPDMLEALLRAKPSGVSIVAIAYTHGDDTSTIIFSGSAQTRSALVAFTENLQKSAAFLDVTLPIQSLIAEEDIKFSFTVTYRHKNI